MTDVKASAPPPEEGYAEAKSVQNLNSSNPAAGPTAIPIVTAVPVDQQPQPIAAARPVADQPGNIHQGDPVGGVCACSREEETCWNSCWCSCLVFARTYDSFGLQKTWMSLLIFAGFLLGEVIALLIGGLILFLLALLGRCSYRVWMRHKLRRSLGGNGQIGDYYCSDLWKQCCLPCCSIAQEARMAKLNQRPHKDFVTGQQYTAEDVTPETPERASFIDHLKQTTMLSKILVGIYVGLSLIVGGIAGKIEGISIYIFVLIFPFCVLYFLYWRRNRHEIPLDSVIKYFFAGYIVSVFSAIVMESVLSLILSLVLVAFFGPQAKTEGMVYNPELFVRAFFRPFGHYALQELDLKTKEGGEMGVSKETIKSHFFLIFLATFVTAFVIAGGVEELTKHMAVRQCWLPLRLQTPRAVTIALVTAALGFAASENMEYVFGSSRGGGIKGASGYENELFVLLLRSLLPVHAICAAIQAVGVIKRDFENVPATVAKILAPAIFLHGFFDFLQFILPVFLWTFCEMEMTDISIVTIVVAVVVTVGGAIYMFYMHRKQRERLRIGAFQRVQNDFEASEMEAGEVNADENGMDRELDEIKSPDDRLRVMAARLLDREEDESKLGSSKQESELENETPPEL
mmetsp:Transcript_19027/g.46727  ORF Transcript_19027/g.46727 Transcript_19027/m.46727 type:complete len:630 (+) Transcript_19027:151-2040(+)